MQPDAPEARPPAAPAVAIDRLLLHAAGDEALARELLRLFAGQCAAAAPRIRPGHTDLAVTAHRLKGAAAAVGAEGVVAAAARIEDGDGSAQALAALTGALAEAGAAAQALADAPSLAQKIDGLAKASAFP
ncbi:MAG: Hpt domain-containing protein [Methylobacteriaceae bacterium]|nr:Hpt domain-containing protein [Methylobacteriaceae bacterium]